MLDELFNQWDMYVADHIMNKGYAFPPSFTDFVKWYRARQKQESVKSPEQPRRITIFSRADRNDVMTFDQRSGQDSASHDVQQRWSDLDKDNRNDYKRRIRKLARDGYALSRIRQSLNLDITMVVLQSIVRTDPKLVR